MSSRGFYLAGDGHLVQLFEPADHTGAENSLVFRMKEYNHATVIISYGATPAADGVITVESCDAIGAGGTNTAIPITYYKCILDFEGALGDVLGAATSPTLAATGMIPTATANTMYVIELEASQLIQGHVGFRVCQANPTGASIMSGIAILSGPRYGQTQSRTVIA
jgi:hypothetical protein